jgi:hypothetical protein
LDRSENELLLEICRALDLADDLNRVLAGEGMTVAGSKGQTRVHPAVASLTAVRALLGRQMAQLALPDPDGEAMPSHQSVQARRAAQARWSQRRGPGGPGGRRGAA